MHPNRLGHHEIHQGLSTLREWSFDAGDSSIHSGWEFDSFKSAMSFMCKVGDIAELHNHHPEFVSNYTRVRIRLSTHDAHGLTHKDFDLALAIDRLVINEFSNSLTTR